MEYDDQADALEAQADDMERGSERLGDEIGRARSDWRSKQSDSSVPGAVEEPSDDEDEAEAQRESSEEEEDNPASESGGPG